MDTTTAPGPARAGRREWIGLAVLALPTLLLSLDLSVLYLALPNLSADLGASSTEQLWILDIYSFVLAGFLVTMGTLGDRIGRRRLLLIGAAGFGVASVLAAYSSTPLMLIASRALLGVAGATLMPSTMALIRNMFHDPKQMGQAIGLWFSCFMGGVTLGPLVGGVLLEHFWWGSAFLLGVPFMVLLLVAGPLLLPENRDPQGGRLDLVSVGLSMAAILPVIYGLKELARGGAAPVPVLALAAGVVVAVLFVRRQRGLAHPLLDLSLFSNRMLSTPLAIGLVAGVVMAGSTLMSTLYLQTVAALTPLNAGLWLLPQNIAMVVGTMVAPILARRVPTANVIGLGLAIAATGLLVHTQVGVNGGIPLLVTGLTLISLGIALPMALTMTLMMGSAPMEKAGSVASLSETSGEFGVALGVAAMGSLGAFVYRVNLADSAPAGLPADVAGAARGGITGAMSSAGRLPGDLGAQLLDAARHAFTSGLNTVAAVGAVAFAATAVAAVVLLRNRGGAGQSPAGSVVQDSVPEETARPAGHPEAAPAAG
ncbi:MFS transporter [Microbispora sp. RL4-1S]|uniref:MFS transporter n=1 Tax=Microbispora oryzae TaxID=2806554 RepID=A0A941ALA6_9ACTN|nr:MFS transporter [Microbispora oryzae]MBP2707966.1 MFS transporter [Microbispora oryzae]